MQKLKVLNQLQNRLTTTYPTLKGFQITRAEISHACKKLDDDFLDSVLIFYIVYRRREVKEFVSCIQSGLFLPPLPVRGSQATLLPVDSAQETLFHDPTCFKLFLNFLLNNDSEIKKSLTPEQYKQLYGWMVIGLNKNPGAIVNFNYSTTFAIILCALLLTGLVVVLSTAPWWTAAFFTQAGVTQWLSVFTVELIPWLGFMSVTFLELIGLSVVLSKIRRAGKIINAIVDNCDENLRDSIPFVFNQDSEIDSSNHFRVYDVAFVSKLFFSNTYSLWFSPTRRSLFIFTAFTIALCFSTALPLLVQAIMLSLSTLLMIVAGNSWIFNRLFNGDEIRKRKQELREIKHLYAMQAHIQNTLDNQGDLFERWGTKVRGNDEVLKRVQLDIQNLQAFENNRWKPANRRWMGNTAVDLAELKNLVHEWESLALGKKKKPPVEAQPLLQNGSSNSEAIEMKSILPSTGLALTMLKEGSGDADATSEVSSECESSEAEETDEVPVSVDAIPAQSSEAGEEEPYDPANDPRSLNLSF